jgi:hypothetical protein
MKKYIGIIFVVFTVLVYVVITTYRNTTEFPVLFEEYEYTSCITTGKHSGSRGLSLVVDYRYKVDGKVYKGGYATSNGTKIKITDGKYLIVYSKKNPAYHVFYELEVNQNNIDEVQISKEDLEKRFDVNSKAKRLKSRYSIEDKGVPKVP